MVKIRLPMQETWVQSPIQEDPTCHGATKPVCPIYEASAVEPGELQLESPCATTTEACVSRAYAPQEQPPQR